MALKSKTQRSLLLGFIGAISACGLVGIYCLIVGNFGWLEGTNPWFNGCGGNGLHSRAGQCYSLGMICRWHPVGMLGIIAVGLALILVLIAIWADPVDEVEWFIKTMGVACVLGVALPHVGLLSLARLKQSYEWARVSTLVAIGLLAGAIWIIILAPGMVDDDVWFRVIGIFAICTSSGTIAVPILHRISAIREHEAIRTTELTLRLTCPRCTFAQQITVGRSKCAGCGLKFSIDIEEEHCEKCGYPLYKLESAVCPECGTPIARPVSAAGS